MTCLLNAGMGVGGGVGRDLGLGRTANFPTMVGGDEDEAEAEDIDAGDECEIEDATMPP